MISLVSLYLGQVLRMEMSFCHPKTSMVSNQDRFFLISQICSEASCARCSEQTAMGDRVFSQSPQFPTCCCDLLDLLITFAHILTHLVLLQFSWLHQKINGSNTTWWFKETSEQLSEWLKDFPEP